MNRWLTLALLVAAGVALALRCPLLQQRPMHNDEAVNAVKFGQLWQRGEYRYDPNEHHGPSLLYATYVLARLTGAPDYNQFSETRLRTVCVLFGAGLILLMPLVVDGLGRKPMVWAAFFTAVSPAMVYYSRYYIHEMLLVFSTFLAIGAGWRYWRTRKIGWALLAGFGLGLMHATKETFVIELVVALIALGLNQLWNRWLDASGLPVRAMPVDWRHLAAAAVVWIVVATLLFSSFFTNPSGPLDSLRTYLPWLNRAGGDSPHIYPWSFYLKRLLYFHLDKGPVWTEVFIFVLAVIGAAAGFFRKGLKGANGSFVRFLAFYSFGLLAAYCFISYKTPWCLLGFWHGMILLAGLGSMILLRMIRPRVVRSIVLGCMLGATFQLTAQACRASFTYGADPRNPYVFAHTSPDLLNLVAKVEKLRQASPVGAETVVKVIAPGGDYWPLPWYLRTFTNIGWYEESPVDPAAPIVIASTRFDLKLDERRSHLMAGIFQLRPQNFLELYVHTNIWIHYLEQNPPKREPDE